ncbi:MAG: PH domain-containing protein, partial [Acidimicrobiales bacterium]
AQGSAARSVGGPASGSQSIPFGADADDTDVEIEVLRRSPMDLVRIGISRWPWAGLVALAPLVALAEDLQTVAPFGLPDQAVVEDSLPAEFGAELLAIALAGVLAVVVVISFLGAVLQVARELVANWDLRLVQTSNGFRRTAGLLSKTSKTSTFSRIQAVRTDQTPIQRLLGIRKLTLPTVGEGDLGVSGAFDDEVGTVRHIVFGRPTEPAFDRRISSLSIFLAVRNRVLIVVPLVALLWRPIGWPALLALAAVPLEWLVARRRWRLRRWSLSPTRIAESTELVNRHTADIDLIKCQTVSVSQSFFERRRNLATVRITTAAGHLAVPLIDHVEAMAVRDRALYAVESDRRSFM